MIVGVTSLVTVASPVDRADARRDVCDELVCAMIANNFKLGFETIRTSIPSSASLLPGSVRVFEVAIAWAWGVTSL